MKRLKYALLGAGAFALLVACVVAYLAFTFEPRDYQPRVVEFVKEKTGRTLDMAGALELTYWPDIGVRLGRLSLTERASAERFADVEDARFSVKLVPLLSGQLVATDLRITGAHIRITRYEDGRLNIDDLLGSEGGALQFDIARVTVERSTISYADLRSGAQYELSGLRLETGRIANGTATPFTLALSASDGAQSFEISGALKARLAFDVSQHTFALQDAAFDLKGRIGDMAGLAATGSGSLEAGSKDGGFSVNAFASRLTGTMRGETVDATLRASKISVLAARATCENLTLDLRAGGDAGTSRVTLAIPRLEQTGNVFKSEAVTAEFDLNRGGHTVRADAAMRMEGDVSGRRLVFDGFKTNFRATGQRLPRAGISGAVSGVARIDGVNEDIKLELAGKVAESRVKAQLAAAGFAAPVYTFAIELDQLDLDRYTTAPAVPQGKSGGIDLTPLETLPANGTLQIGTLKSGGVQAHNLKLVLKP
jgi:AsmA protein